MRRSAIPLQFIVNILLGFAFAYAAQGRIKVDGVWPQPAIYFVLLFLGIVRLPFTLYLYLAHPDWSWFYILEAERIPGILIVTLLFADVATVLGAYYLAGQLLLKGKERALYISSGIGGLAFLLVVSIGWDRLVLYGSYDQFHSGHALGLFEVKLGFALIVMSLGFVTGAGLVGWELWKDSRRAVSR